MNKSKFFMIVFNAYLLVSFDISVAAPPSLIGVFDEQNPGLVPAKPSFFSDVRRVLKGFRGNIHAVLQDQDDRDSANWRDPRGSVSVDLLKTSDLYSICRTPEMSQQLTDVLLGLEEKVLKKLVTLDLFKGARLSLQNRLDFLGTLQGELTNPCVSVEQLEALTPFLTWAFKEERLFPTSTTVFDPDADPDAEEIAFEAPITVLMALFQEMPLDKLQAFAQFSGDKTDYWTYLFPRRIFDVHKSVDLLRVLFLRSAGKIQVLKIDEPLDMGPDYGARKRELETLLDLQDSELADLFAPEKKAA